MRSAPAPCDRRRSSRWGPWAVKPRSMSAARRSAQLRREPVGVAGRRPRAVVQLGSASAARAPPRVPRTGAPAASTASRAVGHQLRRRGAASSRVPGRRASRRRPRRPGCGPSSALRWASAREYAVACLGARRPDRGDTAVEVGPARRRGALHELEALGQEDAEQRPGRGCRQAVHSRAVDPQRLRSPRLEARPRAGGRRPRRPRSPRSPAPRPRPRRTSSRSLEVRGERPVQPKYRASSRFVLPAPLGPAITVRPGPSATSARRVVAEVPQRDGRDAHGRRPATI